MAITGRILPLVDHETYLMVVGGWVGRWCWVDSSAGGGGPTALAYGRARACCAAGSGWVGWVLCVCVCVFFHLVYPIFPFLIPHLLGNNWTY